MRTKTFKLETTDDAVTEMTTDGMTGHHDTLINMGAEYGPNLLVLEDNRCCHFRIECISRDLADDSAEQFTITGVLKRGAGMGTVALVGTPNKTSEPASPTRDLVVSADTGHGSLKIEATGVAAKTIKWLVTATLLEV